MADNIILDMWKSLADSPFVMVNLQSGQQHGEPMHAQLDQDADDCFWFYTTKSNRLAPGGKAMVQFSSKDHKLFACLRGTLSEVKDTDTIDKYWSNKVEAWYQDGRDDEQLLMLRFDLEDAEIWSVDPEISGLIKLATGATIKRTEMGDHKLVSFNKN
ncbi:pyridoxamine 5'-phosphate oxidase family protein [Aliiglaciecola litoralis]|uniref:General stress protein FMN-binding split barrel domain-containing protein n=1 Tax=Aliiglaciecola litoralis TaxID=582857 RepID=A0ABP3WNV4_9ALTE